MTTLVAKWVFEVQQDRYGRVSTKWSVISDDESEYGETEGPLHKAILDAYDGLDITCPLVEDDDLLFLSGYTDPAPGGDPYDNTNSWWTERG